MQSDTARSNNEAEYYLLSFFKLKAKKSAIIAIPARI
jgi:hypothetical protein